MTGAAGRNGADHLGDLLSGLLDGELSPSEEAFARSHLDTCSACSVELDSVGTARAWVRGLPLVEPPFGFFERMLREPAVPGLRGPNAVGARRPWTGRRAGVAALAGSAAAAVVLLGLVPPRAAPVSPAVSRMVQAHATGASLDSDPLSRLAPIGVPVTFNR